MKKMKKLTSILLALVMALGLMTTALATVNDDDTDTEVDSNPPVATDDGTTPTTTPTASITITPQKGEEGTFTADAEYVAYQLLRATLNTDEDGKVVAASYYLNNPSDEALQRLLVATNMFKFTESADGTKWIVELEDSRTTGEALATALNTDDIKTEALSKKEFSMDEKEKKATADGLNVGYYLITSSLGTNLVLQTLGDVTIETKDEDITTEKTASKTNMSVGDIVEYTIKVKIPATANEGDKVTVYDTIDKELAILGSGNIIVNDSKDYAIKAEYTDKNNATVSVNLTPVTPTSSQTYTFIREFTITDGMLGRTVELTYSAELLSTAASNKGYVNEAFGHIPGYDTVPSKPEVWTFDFKLEKTFAGADDATAATYIAKFELYDSNNAKINFIKDSTGYVKADSDDAQDPTYTTTLEVNGNQIINIRGLAAGTYTLKEIATVDGYNLLTDDIIVTITDTSEVDQDGNLTGKIAHEVSYKLGTDGTTNDDVDKVLIVNNTGSTLPDTGGIGTTIFYVVGGVLVVAAVVLLVTKKRMGAKD